MLEGAPSTQLSKAYTLLCGQQTSVAAFKSCVDNHGHRGQVESSHRPSHIGFCDQFNTSLSGMKLTRSPISSVVPSRTSTNPSAHAALRSTPELWLR